MRWDGRRESENVEDRRDDGPVAGGGFGGGLGGRGLPGGRGGGFGGRGVRVGGGLGVGGIVIVLILSLVFGIDPRALLGGGGGYGDPYGTPVERSAPAPASGPSLTAGEDRLRDFVAVVLADTEDVWTEIFSAEGRDYPEPRLVLFRDRVESGCGVADTAQGPFYCPRDRRVYVDLAFFGELRDRFRAPGDFAQAYVIAHEVGHHVQNVLGILERANDRRAQVGGAEANAISVRTELQADCLAGVWANRAQARQPILEPGDVEEALGAAAAVGDDRLQRQGRGQVVPETFTHGTAEQRARWFRTGFESGRVPACDTFAAGP